MRRCLLADEGVDELDRFTWTRPCVRVPCPEGEPFAVARTSPELHAAYDLLIIGEGRWSPRPGVGGSVPVRFPSEDWPGDTGWHIDGNTWTGEDFATDLTSKAQGLLALSFSAQLLSSSGINCSQNS